MALYTQANVSEEHWCASALLKSTLEKKKRSHILHFFRYLFFILEQPFLISYAENSIELQRMECVALSFGFLLRPMLCCSFRTFGRGQELWVLSAACQRHQSSLWRHNGMISKTACLSTDFEMDFPHVCGVHRHAGGTYKGMLHNARPLNSLTTVRLCDVTALSSCLQVYHIRKVTEDVPFSLYFHIWREKFFTSALATVQRFLLREWHGHHRTVTSTTKPMPKLIRCREKAFLIR